MWVQGSRQGKDFRGQEPRQGKEFRGQGPRQGKDLICKDQSKDQGLSAKCTT